MSETWFSDVHWSVTMVAPPHHCQVRTPWEGAHPSQTGESLEFIHGDTSLPKLLSQPCASTNQQENPMAFYEDFFFYEQKNHFSDVKTTLLPSAYTSRALKETQLCEV